MIRFIMGLTLACLFVGCGDPAADTTEKPKDEKEASTTTPATNVATEDHEDHDHDAHADKAEPTGHGEEVAAKEEPAAAPKMITVKFKVPGMT